MDYRRTFVRHHIDRVRARSSAPKGNLSLATEVLAELLNATNSAPWVALVRRYLRGVGADPLHPRVRLALDAAGVFLRRCPEQAAQQVANAFRNASTPSPDHLRFLNRFDSL